MKPLRGRRVLDFSHVLAGPYATMLLADLGADVIKIERPGSGDETRGWGPPNIGSDSAYFHAVNRGKRSVALDLRSDFGRRAIAELAARADVVVENFRPGVAERLGIDYETLSRGNPGLVYVSITGFGSKGPMAQTPGTEVTVEAYSGLMHITGERDGNPVRFGVAMVDLATGMSAAGAVLAALLERAESGRGRRLELSLYETALSCLGTLITAAGADAEGSRAASRWGTGHPSIVPYAAYGARDGLVVIGGINEPMWERLRHALGLGDAARRHGWQTNEQRVADRDRVDAALAEAIAERSVDEVVEVLEAHNVLVAPVRTVEQALRSEQAEALDIVFERGGAVFSRTVLDGGGGEPLGPAPELGRHTDEVLAEIGLDPGAAELRS